MNQKHFLAVCCYQFGMLVCAYNASFSLQSNVEHSAFIHIRDNVFVVFVVISFLIRLPRTKFKMQMQQNILNIELQLHKSLHFNRMKGNEFNVMTNNLLVNGICTLELTLLMLFLFQHENVYTWSNWKKWDFSVVVVVLVAVEFFYVHTLTPRAMVKLI